MQKDNYDYLLYDLLEDESFEDFQKSKSDEKDRALRRRKNTIKAKRRRMKIVSHPGSNRKIYPGNAGWLSNSGSYVVYPKNSQRQKYLKKQTHKKNRRFPIDEDDRGCKGNAYRRNQEYKWELD